LKNSSSRVSLRTTARANEKFIRLNEKLISSKTSSTIWQILL
jgi:hypothetical protein